MAIGRRKKQKEIYARKLKDEKKNRAKEKAKKKYSNASAIGEKHT